jgi:hypothetical protein
MAATIHISDKSHQLLQDLARDTDAPMGQVLEEALEAYRRRRVLDEIGAGFATLRQDPQAWEALERERAEWDATLTDGLMPTDERSTPSEPKPSTPNGD